MTHALTLAEAMETVMVEDLAVDMVVQMVLTNLVAAMEVAGLVTMEGTEESLAGMVAVDMVVVLDLIEEESLHLGTLVVMEEEAVVVTTEVVTAWEVEEEEGTVVDLEICMVGRTVSQQVVMVDQVGVMEVDTVVVGMVEEAIEAAVMGMTWVVLELEAEEVTLVVAEEVEEARSMVVQEEEEVEEDMEEVRDGTILMEGRKFHKAFNLLLVLFVSVMYGYQE